MERKLWNRRQLIRSSVQLAAATALPAMPWMATAHAQMPPPEPLKDDRLTFVTTTETQAWQDGEILKPRFGWELLNLNIDPATTADHDMAPSIAGFGACFNELGWTALSALEERDRESVMHELFDPAAGARLPIAACR